MTIKKPDPEMIDEENPEWTSEMMRDAKKGPDALRDIFGTENADALMQGNVKVRVLGRPKKDDAKIAIKLRLDPHVITRFRVTGVGWQSLMNEALKTVDIDLLVKHRNALQHKAAPARSTLDAPLRQETYFESREDGKYAAKQAKNQKGSAFASTQAEAISLARSTDAGRILTKKVASAGKVRRKPEAHSRSKH